MRHDPHASDDCFDGTEPATRRHNIEMLCGQQPDGEEPEPEDDETPTVLMPERRCFSCNALLEEDGADCPCVENESC